MPVATRLTTPRLVIRRWSGGDAPLLAAAIDASLDHLRRWMPWARREPSPRAVLELRLSQFARAFDDGTDWTFGIFSPDEREVLGGTGLHRSRDDDVLELGCWLRSDMEGRGLATEVVIALCHEAFFRRDVSTVELRTDPHNTRSVRLAERLGFVRFALRYGDSTAPDGSPRDTLAFRLGRDALAPESAMRGVEVGHDLTTTES